MTATVAEARGFTMTSRDPEIGDIWLAYVEFSDHPGAGRSAPSSWPTSSKDLRQNKSGKVVPIIDWADCGLRKPSHVRRDQKLGKH